MENKNDNNLKQALDKIKRRKVLLNNRALEINKRISRLQNYINDNTIETDSLLLEGEKHSNVLMGYFSCFMALTCLLGINDEKDLLAPMLWLLSSKLNFNIANSTYEVPLPLRDIYRKLKHLYKENKKANKIISNLEKKLEDYRENQEFKAHEAISDIFSEENLYYDEDSFYDKQGNVKSI